METSPVLTDPEAVRDHLDLVIDPKERSRHGIWFVLCDDEARPVVHVAVGDMDSDPPDSVSGCEAIVTPFATALSQRDDGSMLVAVTRPGNGSVTDAERRWFHAVHAVCRTFGVTVLAVYLVTPRDMVQIHLDDAG
jgi:hypothetical protein